MIIQHNERSLRQSAYIRLARAAQRLEDRNRQARAYALLVIAVVTLVAAAATYFTLHRTP